MITRKLFTLEDLQQMDTPVVANYNGANIIIDAINEALKEARFGERNLSIIAGSEHCGVIKVTIDKGDSNIYKLCTHNPATGDFEDVIEYCKTIWNDRFAKKSVPEGTRYTLLML